MSSIIPSILNLDNTGDLGIEEISAIWFFLAGYFQTNAANRDEYFVFFAHQLWGNMQYLSISKEHLPKIIQTTAQKFKE